MARRAARDDLIRRGKQPRDTRDSVPGPADRLGRWHAPRQPRRPGPASSGCTTAPSTTATRIDEILDAALICHLGFEHDGQPYVIPTLHARIGDLLYVHGSAASRTLRALGEGIPACVTVTLLDGIVLARSVFEHSMNYRSVVVLGTATPVVDPDEKYAVLEAFTEKLLPGRWADARPPTRKELKATSVLVAAARRGVRQGPSTARPTTATRRTPNSTSGPVTSH